MLLGNRSNQSLGKHLRSAPPTEPLSGHSVNISLNKCDRNISSISQLKDTTNTPVPIYASARIINHENKYMYASKLLYQTFFSIISHPTCLNRPL